MKSIGLDLPEEALSDEFSVYVDIYTQTDGGQDGRGDPVPPAKTYFAQDAKADIQPMSSQDKIDRSGTSYESTDRMIMVPTAQEIPLGARVDEKQTAGGQVVASYTVVSAPNWGTHFQLEMKKESS